MQVWFEMKRGSAQKRLPYRIPGEGDRSSGLLRGILTADGSRSRYAIDLHGLGLRGCARTHDRNQDQDRRAKETEMPGQQGTERNETAGELCCGSSAARFGGMDDGIRISP